jgi:phage FluMu gp28-like protein
MHYVAGVDFGKVHDSTVVTILEVNWDNPRQTVEGYDQEQGSFTVEIYGKHVVDWLELQGDDYEAQYVEIKAFLRKWPIARMALDYTGVGISLGDRFKAMFDNIDVEFVSYSDDSKDALSRQFMADMHNGMITWPGGSECEQRKEFKNFKTQLLDLEKDYKNGLLNLHHPDMRGCHDDFVQSLMLGIHAALNKPFGGQIEESDGIYGRRR